MGKYRVIVKLKNGDEAYCRVDAQSPDDAIDRLLHNDMFMEFIDNNEYERIDVEIVNDLEEMDMERYALTEMEGRKGWYTVVDLDNHIRIDFEKGKFNETQKASWIGEERQMEALEGAIVMRQIADYLLQHHPELVR